MKYYIILTVLSFIGVILFSCKKDSSSAITGNYVCKCSGGLSGQGQEITINNMTRSDAQTRCLSYDQPYIADGYNNCHLQ